MSIIITFEGLCAFFTKNLPKQRLRVGLVEVSDSNLPLTEFHIPKIEIREEGSEQVIAEYTGISGRRCLKGDVFLHVVSGNEIIAPDLTSELGVNGNATLLDVEKDLYPEESLNINPQKSRAILHINNGVLLPNMTAEFPTFDKLELCELKSDGNTEVVKETEAGRTFLYSARIIVGVPEKGYAVLHFAEGADDFVFKADRDYQVAVTCLSQASLHPETMEINHFQYYYKLADNTPSKIVVPELPPGSGNGNPACMNGGSDDTP